MDRVPGHCIAGGRIRDILTLYFEDKRSGMADHFDSLAPARFGLFSRRRPPRTARRRRANFGSIATLTLQTEAKLVQRRGKDSTEEVSVLTLHRRASPAPFPSADPSRGVLAQAPAT